jgi:AraC-like DNA-binding protein
MRVHRTKDLISDDDLLLIVMARGAGELNQRGRIVTVGEGEAVLNANGTPAIFAIPESGSTITYRFSRDLLRPRIPNLDDLVARPIARDSQVLRLLVGYSDVLNEQSALATAELRRSVSTHMHELAVLLLDGKTEARPAEGLRAARLKALKDDILSKITQGSLSVDEIARSQQISERYIRQLFAGEGTTFSDFVREARLARAWRMLTAPSQLHRPINAIALDSGFNDLSYFNRTFRKLYDMTPTEARALARQRN